MTRIFIPTVGSSATSANRRHSRLPLQAAPGTARGIVTSSRATPSKPPSTPSRPRFASASGGKADGELALFPIAAQVSGRLGSLRGFLPRALSNACPHASSCTHGLRTRAGIEQRLTSRARHFVGSILHRFGRSGWYLLRRGIRLHHNLLCCPINSEFSILFARAAISRLRPDTPAPRPVARRRPCGDRRISSAP
jgi:hypothetical protein